MELTPRAFFEGTADVYTDVEPKFSFRWPRTASIAVLLVARLVPSLFMKVQA